MEKPHIREHYTGFLEAGPQANTWHPWSWRDLSWEFLLKTALGTTLHFEGHSDLDSRELVQEIKNFPHLPSKPWASLSLSFLCMIRIYRRSTPTFGLLSGLHLLCQSLWLREELFKTKVDQIVPEVNHVSGTAHWPCYNQYQSLNRGADFVWWHYWWFCIKEGPNGLVLVWVFCS